VSEFHEFWTRDEPKELTEPNDPNEPKEPTEPKDLMEPIGHMKLNSHPYASPLPITGAHPPYSSSYTHTQIETFMCTNKVFHRTRSTEPSENDMHIQFSHGLKSDTPPIRKRHTCHRPAGPSNTHPMKTFPES